MVHDPRCYRCILEVFSGSVVVVMIVLYACGSWCVGFVFSLLECLVIFSCMYVWEEVLL